jgi:transcriptional regulator GlxA family with amidase domain
VSILVPNGHFSLVNIEGTHQILSWVNGFLQSIGREPVFDVHLVGLSRSTTQTNGLFTINPDMMLNAVPKTDLIFIPAIHGDVNENVRRNAEVIPWLVKQYNDGAEIVSMCIGSFFLAKTGLLDGKACSTHWSFANEFRNLFPEAKLMDDRIITEADGIYTSGGAYSFTNLLIYLVERYAGREVAIVTAKAFMIDIDRCSQSLFTIFAGQKAHDDHQVLSAQEFIEQNYQERINVDQLSDTVGVGRRTFERRFKKATANTVIEYIQRVKIEAAKKQLESGRKTVSEVMYDVGYNDTKAFRDVFRKVTGVSPVEYRNKYQQVVLQN